MKSNVSQWTCLLIGFLILLISLHRYNLEKSRSSMLRKELINQIIHSAQIIQSCNQLIGMFGDTSNCMSTSQDLDLKGKPDQLIKIIRELNEELSSLVSHNFMIINRFRIFFDCFSKEVSVGYEFHPWVKCSNYRFTINGVSYNRNNDHIYEIPCADSLHIIASLFNPYNISLKSDVMQLERMVKLK